MALDGVALANIAFELKELLLGGRVDKIYQPESDEIIMAVRSLGNNYKLLLTANASHPRIHLTQIPKENPMIAPMFCMVLRKHIAGGKITAIEQPNFERILNIHIESLNEMGDSTVKKLVIEIMGKHSNIMLLDENETILDCIKHVTHDTSSVREVLPGKKYVLPPSQNKLDILELTKETFIDTVKTKKGVRLQEIIFGSYTGISPILATEICFRADIDPSKYAEELSDFDIEKLYNTFACFRHVIVEGRFTPVIITDEPNNKIIDFSSVEMTYYSDYKQEYYRSISALLENFYYKKDNSTRMKQKTHDLNKLVNSNIDRCIKKREIQNKTLKDISDREKWKRYGELITSNIYQIQKGETRFETQDFYEETLPIVKINLDAELTPVENAQRYFNKYNKAKRTFAALQDQILQNDSELEYLEQILTSLNNSSDEANIAEIHTELTQEGYIKKRKAKKGEKVKKTKPMHYMSSEEFDIYVGKNNIQNDELTLKFASSNDIWLHTKDIPGSHVIIKTKGYGIPEDTIVEAAQLAAFFSKGRDSSSVPVDYTLKKNVKKPNGAKPGMVIYEENKTLYVTPDEAFIKTLKEIK
jgi:predicted ribosome quality control (RQC) complex YloA/Tae2 family protein